jgi:hypothetical protein
LIGLRNEIFFRRGLDTPNQFEFAEQIKVYVKSNFGHARSMRTAIAAHDLPVGQISGAVACYCWRMTVRVGRALANPPPCSTMTRRCDGYRCAPPIGLRCAVGHCRKTSRKISTPTRSSNGSARVAGSAEERRDKSWARLSRATDYRTSGGRQKLPGSPPPSRAQGFLRGRTDTVSGTPRPAVSIRNRHIACFLGLKTYDS